MLTPIKQQNYSQPVGHFLTVTGFSDDGNSVIVNDPLVGEKKIEVNQFNANWQANGARGVVVAQSPIPTVPESAAPLFAGVGAAAALAGLAALGTARKGLGAGVYDESQNDSWTNYDEPAVQPVDSWSNYVPFAPDPPDTWFDSRTYDEGPHEQVSSAPEPQPPQDSRDVDSGPHEQTDEQKQELVDALAEQERERQRQQRAQDSGPHEQSAEEKQELVDALAEQERERQRQQQAQDSGPHEQSAEEKQQLGDALHKNRQQEIKTIEDAQKLAQVEAERAAAAALAVSQTEKPKEKSWLEKTQDIAAKAVLGTLPDVLIKLGQNSPLAREIIANNLPGAVDFFASSGDASRNPQVVKWRQETLASIENTVNGYQQAWDGVKALGDYTGKAIQNGSWDDIGRAAGAWGQVGVGSTVELVKAWAQSQNAMAQGILMTPVRLFTETIPNFQQAWKERNEGKDRFWDTLFTGTMVVNDVAAVEGMGYGVGKATGIVDRANASLSKAVFGAEMSDKFVGKYVKSLLTGHTDALQVLDNLVENKAALPSPQMQAANNWQAALSKNLTIYPENQITSIQQNAINTAIKRGWSPGVQISKDTLLQPVEGQPLAVQSLPKFAGRSIDEIQDVLQSKGFAPVLSEGEVAVKGGGVQIWINGTDGSVVRIDSLGNPTGFKTLYDMKGNITQGFGNVPHVHREPFHIAPDLIGTAKVPNFNDLGTNMGTFVPGPNANSYLKATHIPVSNLAFDNQPLYLQFNEAFGNRNGALDIFEALRGHYPSQPQMQLIVTMSQSGASLEQIVSALVGK